MDKMTLKKVHQMLCHELDEIADKGQLSAGDLDAVQKLMSAEKNATLLEQMGEGDYANAYDGGGYSNRYYRDYDRGSSYRSGNSYSGRGRYSRAEAEDGLMDALRELARDGSLPDHTRRKVQKALDEMS